ncbi:MAG: MATE family efflux transporter [Clostridiales Family XIII bacterium]|jgi:putative MATE family efflux protein|nr:MATE family efflux transporter [Clostridiales Family XIII bacterium]
MDERKELLYKIIILTIPASIEFMLQAGLSYVDFIMVGQLGKDASAAIGLTQEVNFLLKGVLMAVGIGIVSYISIAMGMRKYDMVKRGSVQAFFLAVITGGVLMIVALILAPALPGLLGAEESIHAPAVAYFRIVYLSAVFTAFNMLLAAVLKGVGDMRTPMYVNGIISIANVILNYFLIYDSRIVLVAGFRFPVWGAGLGVQGSAWGTAAASVLGGVLMIVGVLKNPLVSPRREKFMPDPLIIRRIVFTAIPVLLSRSVTSIGRLFFTAFVVGLGTLSLAAHTVAFAAEGLCYMAVVGMQAAATTLAGNCKGEGSQKKLDQLTRLSCILIGAFMSLVAILMFVMARLIISTLSTDPDVIQIGTTLFRIVAFNEPIFAISVIMEGIFNGTGDTKSPFIIAVITLWFVRVLGAWFAIYILGAGVYGAWVCMIAENTVRGAALLVRYRLVHEKLIGGRLITNR